MRCRACRKRISPYLDGELRAAEREQVEAHLAHCPRCATARQQLEQAQRALDRLPGIEPSAGFDAAFARKLQQAEQERARQAEAAPRRRSWLLGSGGWRLPAIATVAAAAAVVTIAVSVNRLQRHDLVQPLQGIVAELDVVRNLDLLRDYEVVSRLDALEDFEVVANLDRLLAEQQGGRR